MSAQGVTEVSLPALGLDPATRDEPVGESDAGDPRSDRQRFVFAALIGSILASIPYIWFLTDDWSGKFLPLRNVQSFSDFYDLQAEAMIHGHFWVTPSSLGIEGFLHDGRIYTYFGPLLSIIRIPFLLIAPGLNGRLTAPSMLAAWMLTALFTSLLIWRVRTLLRGSVALGKGEATALGILVATVLGGTVFLFLASAPWVYSEDLAWAVPTTVASVFVFIGILDRPTLWNVVALGGLLLAGVLGRPTEGLACAGGALLIAVWFGCGLAGREHRRWATPMALAGVIPLGVAAAVNYLKFGAVLSLPLSEQVWTQENAHRRAFLAATGGKGYSLHFIPTMLWAFLQPLGLRAQPAFPWLTLPIQPPHVFGGFTIDSFYSTPSVPATMPLLFLLACWGVVVAVRRRSGRGARLIIPLLVTMVPLLALSVYGYIAPRYLADFLPFLILGSAIGMVDLWRHLVVSRAWVRRLAICGILALAMFSFVVNAGIAAVPQSEWTVAQSANYLHTVQLASNALGDQIVHSSSLPYWAPQNQVDIVRSCAGLYLSDGVHNETVPTQQAEHATWLPVEQGPGIIHQFRLTIRGSSDRLGSGTPLLTVGRDRILVESDGSQNIRFVLDDPNFVDIGGPIMFPAGSAQTIHVETDPYLHLLEISLDSGKVALKGVLDYPGATPVASPGNGSGGPVDVTEDPTPTSGPLALPLPRAFDLSGPGVEARGDPSAPRRPPTEPFEPRQHGASDLVGDAQPAFHPVVDTQRLLVGVDEQGVGAVTRSRPVLGGAHHRVDLVTEVVQRKRPAGCSRRTPHRLRVPVEGIRISGEHQHPVDEGSHRDLGMRHAGVPELEIPAVLGPPVVVQIEQEVDPALPVPVLWVDGVIGVDVEVAARRRLVEAPAFETRVGKQPLDPGELFEEPNKLRRVQLVENRPQRRPPGRWIGLAELPLVDVEVGVPPTSIQRGELLHRRPGGTGVEELVEHDVGVGRGTLIPGRDLPDLTLPLGEIQDPGTLGVLSLSVHVPRPRAGFSGQPVRHGSIGPASGARRSPGQAGSSSKTNW